MPSGRSSAFHHAYEAGHYQDPGKLVGLAFATAMLAVVLVALGQCERTGSRHFPGIFTAVTLVWWVGLVGLYMGAYNYLLKNVLFGLHAISPATLSALFPTEHLPPADIFHEGSGLLMAVLAAWVALAWRQLVVLPRPGHVQAS